VDDALAHLEHGRGHLLGREVEVGKLGPLRNLPDEPTQAPLVAVFYYPTTFTARQQTVFGWFENDVYTGLLMIAAYLSAQRLRGITLTIGRR